MTDRPKHTNRDRTETARQTLIDAAIVAYEDAGLSGLCAEGRWEAAVDAMRSVDLVEGPQADSVAELIASLSRAVAVIADASAPPPSGGSVAAAVGALAAALTQMVAGLTVGRPRYAHVAEEMRSVAERAASLATDLTELVRQDAVAVEAVTAAYRLPKGTDENGAARTAAIEQAMHSATVAPFEIARAAAAVAELAATVAERGNTNAVADAAVAAVLAEAVCRASVLTVRVNVPALRDTHGGARLEAGAMALAEAAATAAARAVTGI